MRLTPLLVLLALPAAAQAEPRRAMVAPQPGCAAPALLRAAELHAPEEAAMPPSHFRMAVLSCPSAGQGPPKRPLRWT